MAQSSSPRNFRLTGWRLALALLLTPLAVAAGYGQFADAPFLRNIETATLDLRFRLRGPHPAGRIAAVVAVDERAMTALGRWPVSRDHLARAVELLKADGARVIVFDMLLGEAGAPDADRRFADAVAKAGNVVLPYALLFGRAPGETPPPLPAYIRRQAYARIHVPDGEPARTAAAPTGHVAPAPVIGEAAMGLGHVTVFADADGSPRYDFPALKYDWAYYPSLAVTAARAWLGLPAGAAAAHFGEGVRLDDLRIPTDADMRLLVNYSGPPGAIPVHSLLDLIEGRLPAGLFRDRLALVGVSAPGLSDAFATPYASARSGGVSGGERQAMSGIERQAMLIESILAGDHLTRPDVIRHVETAAVIGLGALAALLGAWAAPALLIPGALALLGLWAALCQWAFQGPGVWVNASFPAAAVILSLAVAFIIRASAEIRARRAAETALRISGERDALALAGTNDGAWDWDLDRDAVYYAPRWQAMVGLDAAPLTAGAGHWFSRVAPLDRPLLEAAIAAHLDGRTARLVHEYRLRHSDGEIRWMLARGAAVRDGDGRARRLSGTQTDVTQRRRAKTAAQDNAFHDPLTGLVNRTLLFDRLEQALACAARGGGPSPALLEINIDGFRHLVETLGPLAADRLLTAVARRLEALAEPGDTTARLGGDSFAILLAEPAAAAERAAAAHQALTLPFHLEGRDATLTISIGVAMPSDPQSDAAETLRDAALAAHAARDGGPGRTALFDDAMRSRVDRRFELEAEMRAAVRGEAGAGGFELFYQPIVALPDRTVEGFEALMRWRHPTRGLILPDEFIPLAEETGMIAPLGAWAIGEACRQVFLWRRLTGRNLTVAVNISGRQFAETDLLAVAGAALTASGAPPEALKLEVTEAMIMRHPERAAETLWALMDQGIEASIDDFGAGCSSLAYLHKLPFTTLKIDRSFVAGMGESPEGQEIVAAIVALARSLGRKLVAEGVETERHAAGLCALRVDRAQGDLFGPPLPAAGVERLLVNRAAAPPRRPGAGLAG